MRMQSLSVTLSAVLQLTFFAFLHGASWTYNGPEGEHHWSKHYPFCGGAFQSPIDIQSDLLRFDPTLRPIEVQNYNLMADEQLTLGNNGHSVQLSLPSKMHISSLPQRYSAAQLHLHWGSSNMAAGSEHLVNGKQFAAEMHVVHFNSDKYADVSMAVDKSDGLAVLGVLIEVGEFNAAFDQFLKFINGIKYRDQRVQVPGFNIRTLLPARLDEYYRYDGSLTTPPCYPSVLWTVFRNPIKVSQQQFLALASAVYSSHRQESALVPLNGNYRKPQLGDNRVVLVSFKEDGLSWMNFGVLVLVVMASALGSALICSLLSCRRSGTNTEKNTGVGYDTGEEDKHGSTVSSLDHQRPIPGKQKKPRLKRSEAQVQDNHGICFLRPESSRGGKAQPQSKQ